MTRVPASAFPDPAVREAAQFLVEGRVTEAVDLIQSNRAAINYVGPQGDTLLLIAVIANNRPAVRSLLDVGFDPNLPKERAPLAVAVENSSMEIVSDLLAAHAQPDGKVKSESALWRAALGARKNVAELLLRHGAQVDLANVDGDTPALAAVESNQFSMALFLLHHGASPFASSSLGHTLGFWAARSRLSSSSKEGRARDALIFELRQKGFPWPPPTGKEVISAKAVRAWPPHG